MITRRVLLGIPSGGSVKDATLMSVVGMVGSGAVQSVYVKTGTIGPENRNVLCSLAIEHGFTHLFLLDADMGVPADAVTRLLAHGKDLIGAAYNYRGASPVRTVVKFKNADGAYEIPEVLPDTLFQCAAIGSGCKLISVDALKRIPKPWFALRNNAEGFLDQTDDVWFCERAAAVGIPTWCDPTIGPIEHIGDYSY